MTSAATGSASADDWPRADELRAVIAGIWEAADVGTDALHLGRYFRDFRRNAAGCSHLDYDDRWYAQQDSSLPPGQIDQSTIEARIVGHLEQDGFSIDRYRSTHPESKVRRFWATRGDTVVYATFNADGATSVRVRSGPCAPFSGGFDPELYQPDDR